MLGGLKFISRDKIERAQNDDSDDSVKEMEKSRSRKKKHRKKTKSSRYGNSDVERIEKRSGKKKWYSSDEYSSSESESSSDREEKKGRDNRKSRSKSKRSKGERMVEEDGDRSKKRSKCRQDGRRKSEESEGQEDIAAEDFSDSGRGTSRSLKEMEIVRKEMGLEWMLRPADRSDNRPVVTVDDKSEETPTEEIKKVHPKELNPFLKDNGSGYPEDTEGSKASGDQLLSSSVVGDGGASWRLKALKRAREQAAREGRRLEEVVEERWGSLGQLAVSVASRTAAPSRAHIHAIRDRKRGLIQEQHTGSDDQRETYIKKQEVEKIKQGAGDNSIGMQNEGSSSRHIMRDRSVRQKKDEDDADMYLARKIMHNKKYTTYGQADDEYDFEDGPSKKDRKKGGGNEQQGTQKSMRLLTQQERCLFCFENPNMPKHLIVSIANFTYLMLPHWQSVVPGHCYIVPQQHESATRTVENNVWEEIRNFKKCLIMMFAKQEKDVVFLETVMGLAQQCCHCLIECIPLPKGIAKQAPLYFKKAIDEAEDEWSQHNAKKLIDTSEKGLRGCIPKNFPYFHVEFGLHKGLVHVIDDEEQFKSSLGLNVIRGMLHLPEEDMYRHRRYKSVEVQREAVKSFLQDWEPFDWTTQLHQQISRSSHGFADQRQKPLQFRLLIYWKKGPSIMSLYTVHNKNLCAWMLNLLANRNTCHETRWYIQKVPSAKQRGMT